MAFYKGWSKAGHKVERLNTTAEVEFVPGTGITTITLTTVGHIHGIDAAEFQKEAEAAKEGCPISKALHGNVALKLNARLDLALERAALFRGTGQSRKVDDALEPELLELAVEPLPRVLDGLVAVHAVPGPA